jgi:predicted MFS family arabinose efflux permease
MTKKQFTWMIILGVVVFTNIIESMILMPMASTIKATLHINDNQWGIVISSYLFSAFAAGITSIFLVDKFDRKNFLLVVYSLFIIGTLLCGLSTSYELLVFARIVAGFFGGVISAVTLSIVGDLIAAEHRGTATGIVMAGFSTAAALGIPLGLYLGLNWSWHAPFFFIVGMSLITLVAIFFVMPPVNAHLAKASEVKSWEILRRIPKNSNQVKALIFSCLLLFGQFGIIPYLADYVEHNIGFKKNELVWMYFFGGILTFITNPFIGYLSDRFGQKRIFLIVMLISCVPIALLTSMGKSPMPVVLIVTSGFFVFAGGRNIPGTATVISTAAPYERGGFMSVRSAAQQLASGIAVLLGSWILYQDANGKYFNFEFIGYIALGTSVVSYFILRTIKSTY